MRENATQLILLIGHPRNIGHRYLSPIGTIRNGLLTTNNFRRMGRSRQFKYTLIKVESQCASKRQGIDCRNSARAANDSCDINASAVIRKNSMGIFNARIDEQQRRTQLSCDRTRSKRIREVLTRCQVYGRNIHTSVHSIRHNLGACLVTRGSSKARNRTLDYQLHPNTSHIHPHMCG